MGQPVHRFLEDFSPPIDSVDRGPVELKPRLVHRSVVSEPTPQEVERQKLQDAYDRGVEHGMASARAVAEAELAVTVAAHQIQLEEGKQLLAGTLADRLARELRTGLDEVQASISKQAAAALLPVFGRVMTEAAILDLAAELGGLLNETPALVATITGSQQLVERLRRALAGLDEQTDLLSRLAFHPGQQDNLQVLVQVENSLIELRLAEWLSRLDEAIL